MNYYLIWIFSWFCLLTNSLSAQNLIPNSSFENYSNCPITSDLIYYADGWFQPHKYPNSNSVNLSSSSDYFNDCNDSTSSVSIPNNFFGFQSAKTGNAYIGLSFYNYLFNQNGGREYAQVMLINELIANKKYRLKYYLSMANESRYSITKFDAYFSNDSLLYVSSNFFKIPVTPQIQYSARVSDTLNWIEVSASFFASGGERFLTIGNFHDGALCDTLGTMINSLNNCCAAYYYIDDVSLEEDTLTSIYEINRADFNLYPNPAAKKIQLSTAQKISSVKVLNLQTKPVLLLNPGANQTEIALDELTSGIYFVECKFTNCIG